jgi:hypothetical protein
MKLRNVAIFVLFSWLLPTLSLALDNQNNRHDLINQPLIQKVSTAQSMPCQNPLPPRHWSLTLGTAIPFNFPTSLHISQDFQNEIHFKAHYETRPFHMPYYYDIRIGKWDGCMAWEFEDIHHKIYLRNINEDVQHFSISHGYNLFYFNRAICWHSVIWRLGAGWVIAHPESTIRGHTLDEKGGTCNNSGYYLAGATAQGSISKRLYLPKKWFVEVEGKITASEAHVVVVNGDAEAPNIAVHANLSIGRDF